MTSTDGNGTAAQHPRVFSLRRLVVDVVKFGAVGGGSYLIDLAIFNALRIGAHGWLAGPLVDKSIGIAVATVAAWAGNRYWTFSKTRRSDTTREFVEFAVVAVAGWLLNLAVLWFSHDVLGFRSVLADNISGNLIGAALGAALRFVAYRWWVYADRRGRATQPAQ